MRWSAYTSERFLLRTDIHRLFDLEHVIVSSDCRLKISSRLKDRFDK